MGQKVNPYGFRLGITTDHTSRWFSDSQKVGQRYKDFVAEDVAIRRLLLKRVGHTFELETLILDLLEEVLLVFFAELLLLVLRMEEPIDTFDVALHRFDAFDGLFHLVDEAALDRLSEFDFADSLRDLDARTHRRPARLAVFPLIP